MASMQLKIEKFGIEITPADLKFLAQREALLLQNEQADSTSRMSTFSALVPVLMQIFSKIIDGNAKPVEIPPRSRPSVIE